MNCIDMKYQCYLTVKNNQPPVNAVSHPCIPECTRVYASHSAELCTQSNLLHRFSVQTHKQYFPSIWLQRGLFLHLAWLNSTHPSVMCQLQFSRCWWGRLTLILSVTMFSNYHGLHTNMIAWLAVLFLWQLLWFWLCQSFTPSSMASNNSSWSHLLFSLLSCVWWLFEVSYSLCFYSSKNLLKIHALCVSTSVRFQFENSF